MIRRHSMTIMIRILKMKTSTPPVGPDCFNPKFVCHRCHRRQPSLSNPNWNIIFLSVEARNDRKSSMCWFSRYVVRRYVSWSDSQSKTIFDIMTDKKKDEMPSHIDSITQTPEHLNNSLWKLRPKRGWLNTIEMMINKSTAYFRIQQLNWDEFKCCQEWSHFSRYEYH